MKKHQQGVFLIEALIAILIFSLGILGMVAMGGIAIAAQSDAQYRTEAANYANEIASAIALDIAPANYATELPDYANRPIPGGTCTFGGSASTKPVVAAWVDRVTGVTDPKRGLPGATAVSQQIMVDVTPGSGFNKLTITVCWQPPSSAAIAFAPPHQFTLVSYIN
ncbi:MAG: hypothetical protein ABI699_05610 [Caldimonas sp.]